MLRASGPGHRFRGEPAYADVARVLEENLDVWAVKAFEDQIQSFVDHADRSGHEH